MIRDIIESRAKQTPTDQPLCKRLIAAGAMKAAMPPTVWVTGCSSWYLGKDGLPELFPWTPERPPGARWPTRSGRATSN